MTDDTSLGGDRDKFPATRLSAIVSTGSHDLKERQRAYESLILAYWKPVYKTVRLKWNKSNEDAKDLTQAFFTRVMEKGFFDRYDPAKARFRTFLRTCLERFVSNEEKAAGRIKRGGDAVTVPLDFEGAEEELKHTEPVAVDAIETYFEAEWVRSLFSLSIASLQAELESNGKVIHFRLFERYALDDSGVSQEINYQELAKEYGLTVSQITNYLALARREFRRIVLEKLHELTATEEEFRREARALLGVDIK
ncbi:MAG: hypothetical protein DMG05_08210 [Acidobacteria bacterium]|nr:MAG: hypothetical protein DMG05_08210 [Acidobacteriota bacterium]